MTYRSVICLAAGALALAFACGNDKKATDAAIGGDSPGAGTDSAVLDSPGSGSGSGSNMVGPSCGSASCTSGDVCCVGSGAQTCAASCGSGTLSFACDGPSDCGSGQACCYTAGSGGGTECVAGSSCGLRACNGSADCTEGNATNCCAFGSSSYSYCAVHCP